MATEKDTQRQDDQEQDGSPDSQETEHNLAIRERIREQCRARLMECARQADSAMSEKDVEVYVDLLVSEDGLDKGKPKDDDEKTKWAQQSLQEQIPRFIEKAKAAGQKVMALLKEARDEHAISKENMLEWVCRMKDGSWMQTEEFIKNKLPTYVKNWKKVAADRRKLLKDPRMKTLKASKILDEKELATFMNGAAFLNVHYEKRVHLVGLIKASLSKVEAGPNMDELKEMAMDKLKEAVSMGILGSNKVGVWMGRIFSDEHSEETIQNFLNGKGQFPLSTLMSNWKEVKGRFDNLASLRDKKGTPMSFRFVSTQVFLGWEYEKRASYVEEAERRFEAIESEPDLFLRIRHELDVKDWEAAEEMITDAEAKEWSQEDQQKLASMKQFLKSHRTETAEEDVEKQSPSPDEIVEDMREALQMIPFDHIRQRFVTAMKYDYQTLWALCTMHYNWEWCRLNGYSSDEIDHRLRETAKQETYIAEEHGASRDHVNLDATTDTSVKVFRDSNDTNSAQAIHVDNTTDNEQLVQKVHQNKDNRAVWYWTRIMEKDVPYSFFQYMIHNIQPRLKSGMRKLDSMGYKFTESGPARRKDGQMELAKKEEKSDNTGYALAA